MVISGNDVNRGARMAPTKELPSLKRYPRYSMALTKRSAATKTINIEKANNNITFNMSMIPLCFEAKPVN
jgi:hypothetical protein